MSCVRWRMVQWTSSVYSRAIGMVDGIVAVLPGKFLKSLRNHISHQVGGLFGGTWTVSLIAEPLGFVQDT